MIRRQSLNTLGITTSGDYMNGLIDEILDLNRIEDNCFKLEPEVVDVGNSCMSWIPSCSPYDGKAFIQRMRQGIL